MIVQKNFLSKLREFGLNTYESKLWTALLSRGSSTAGELSDIATVPRSRTYDVLESLEKKGFILRKLGKPIKYIAVPPEEVVERVKAKVRKDTDSHLKLIEELRDSDLLQELSLLHTKGIELIEPSEICGSISGRENIHNHLESRIAKAKTKVSLLTTTEGIKRKSKILLPIFRNLKSKGVDIKIATQIVPEIQGIIKDLSKYAKVKHTDLEGRFCIVDSKELILMLLDDEVVHPSYDTAIWINSEYLSGTFQELFDSNWKK